MFFSRYRKSPVANDPSQAALQCELLEDRQMLNGAFGLDTDFLTLDSLVDDVEVTFTEDATAYLFTLSLGTWNGTDQAGVSGNGVATLSVEKSVLSDRTIALDGSGSANTVVTFDGFEFNSSKTLDIDISNVLRIGQAESVNSFVTLGQVRFDSDDLFLFNPKNDFEAVFHESVTGPGDITLVDRNDLMLQGLFGNTIVVRAGGDLTDAAGTHIQSEVSMSLRAGGDIVLADNATDSLVANMRGVQFVQLDSDVSSFISVGEDGVPPNAGSQVNLNKVSFQTTGDVTIRTDNKVRFGFGSSGEVATSMANNVTVETSASIGDFFSNLIVQQDLSLIANGNVAIGNVASGMEYDQVTVNGITTVATGGTVTLGKIGANQVLQRVDLNELNFQAASTAEIAVNNTLLLRGNNMATDVMIDVETGSLLDRNGTIVDVTQLQANVSGTVALVDSATGSLSVSGLLHIDAAAIVLGNSSNNQVQIGRLQTHSSNNTTIFSNDTIRFEGDVSAAHLQVDTSVSIFDEAGTTIDVQSIWLFADDFVALANEVSSTLLVSGFARFNVGDFLDLGRNGGHVEMGSVRFKPDEAGDILNVRIVEQGSMVLRFNSEAATAGLSAQGGSVTDLFDSTLRIANHLYVFGANWIRLAQANRNVFESNGLTTLISFGQIAVGVDGADVTVPRLSFRTNANRATFFHIDGEVVLFDENRAGSTEFTTDADLRTTTDATLTLENNARFEADNIFLAGTANNTVTICGNVDFVVGTSVNIWQPGMVIIGSHTVNPGVTANINIDGNSC